MLNIALPKGRIAKETLQLFSRIFGEDFGFDDRKLILQKGDFCFMLVRSQDVATYVYHQAADIGVVGLDVLEEQPYNIMRLLNLNIGKCRVVVGAHAHKPIAVSYTHLTLPTTERV